MKKSKRIGALREESGIVALGRESLRRYSAAEIAFEWLDVFIIALIAVIMLFTVAICKVDVDGSSMVPTLNDKDQLIISGFHYTPRAGDIVIISRNHSNLGEAQSFSDKPLVKRIIATEGQTVEIKDGGVYIDGKLYAEPYLDKNTVPNGTEDNGFTGRQTVPAGCVFVLGDNRPDSHDSRAEDIGFIDEDYILGKVLFRIYPFNAVKSFFDE